jgi:glutamate 5-kinase
MGLIQTYESCFQEHKLHTAQLLLTHEDLSDRKRYLNIGSTIGELLDLGVIPIINENDSVVTDEICFGDNDMLAALVTNLIDADALVILTDQNGLYTSDPRIDPKAKLLNSVMAEDTMLEQIAGDTGSSIGRGGMLTKITAAKLAAKGGANTIIASGHEENILIRLEQGEVVGTEILTNTEKLAARKQWIAGLQINGSITLDEGAVTALLADGTSILSVGVIDTTDNFERGEAVHCMDMKGEEIALGLINYSATETRKILGRTSDEIEPILGYVDEVELINRKNLVLI